ncbi:unnamed protein product, partial [marine sediment metagenome]
FTLTVINVNDPPVIVSDLPPLIEVLEDEVYTLELIGKDDEDDDLIWSDDSDMFDIDPVTAVITFVPVQDDVGIYDITITIDDGNGGTDVLTFRLEVIEVNDPPEIVSDLLPLIEVLEDEAFSLDLTGVDEEDDALTWSDDSDLFDISPSGGAINFIPSQSEVGEWWVNITIEDSGGLTDEVLIRFVVQNVNDIPVITSISPENGTSYKEGRSETITGGSLTLITVNVKLG